MTPKVAELKKQKNELLQKLEQLKAHNADALEIQIVKEDLYCVNSAIRKLDPGHRVGGKGVGMPQYTGPNSVADIFGNTWGEINAAGATWTDMQLSTETLKKAVASAKELLSETQYRYFSLWIAGNNLQKIADICGVNPSTVSRSLRDARRTMREKATFSKLCPRHGTLVLDFTEEGSTSLLMSTCTSKQAIVFFLYYGEWLSLQEIADLLHVSKSVIYRMVKYALENLSRATKATNIEIDNAEVLGDIAYSIYIDTDYSSQEMHDLLLDLQKKREQARASIKKAYPKSVEAIAARPEGFHIEPGVFCGYRTPDVKVSVNESKISYPVSGNRKTAPSWRSEPGKLLKALIARSAKDGNGLTFAVLIASIFESLKRTIQTKLRKNSDEVEHETKIRLAPHGNARTKRH